GADRAAGQRRPPGGRGGRGGGALAAGEDPAGAGGRTEGLMALTLTESAKLSTDMIQRGVIETILEESPVMALLPFITVEGNSYKYNQENALGGAAFFAVSGTWTEAT